MISKNKEYRGSVVMDTGLKFYKLTNGKEFHRGHKYYTGLNIDKQNFKPVYLCERGGMHFFSSTQLVTHKRHTQDAVFIRSVYIPEDARVYIDEQWKFKANKLVLGEKKIFDILDYIDYEVCINAVKDNWLALGCVPEEFKNEEICWIAVNNNPKALRDVPEKFKTEEMCWSAITKYSHALEYVPEKLKTKEMCIYSFKKNVFVLKYIPDRWKTQDMCSETITIKLLAGREIDWGGSMLRYVPERMRTEEMCIIALRYDCTAIKYIPDYFKTLDMCLEAVKKDGCMLQYVPNELKTDEICMIAVEDFD